MAILFGRSRGTEDIDIFVPVMENDRFATLYRHPDESGYEFLDAEPCEGLYRMLGKGMGIRISEKSRFIPNIKLKFAGDETSRQVLFGVSP